MPIESTQSIANRGTIKNIEVVWIKDPMHAFLIPGIRCKCEDIERSQVLHIPHSRLLFYLLRKEDIPVSKRKDGRCYWDDRATYI